MHQIELLAGAVRGDGNKITVSCTCLKRIPWKQPRGIIESRLVFPAAEAKAAWRDWHAAKGIEVGP